MNTRYGRFALAWFASMAVGCASAPIRYYTLSPPSDKASRTSQPAVALDVRVVHIPPQLDRTELMVRTGSAEITLLENERWASPVNDEIKEALRLELQRRLDGATRLPPGSRKLAIDIDVQRFEAELGRYAMFEASWRATLSGEGPATKGSRVMMCTFRADEQIQEGYAGMVQGYQREIAALADTIVAALPLSASGMEAPCQPSIQ
jgi:uncharacterized lipoprotein YmbA